MPDPVPKLIFAMVGEEEGAQSKNVAHIMAAFIGNDVDPNDQLRGTQIARIFVAILSSPHAQPDPHQKVIDTIAGCYPTALSQAMGKLVARAAAVGAPAAVQTQANDGFVRPNEAIVNAELSKLKQQGWATANESTHGKRHQSGHKHDIFHPKQPSRQSDPPTRP